VTPRLEEFSSPKALAEGIVRLRLFPGGKIAFLLAGDNSGGKMCQSRRRKLPFFAEQGEGVMKKGKAPFLVF